MENSRRKASSTHYVEAQVYHHSFNHYQLPRPAAPLSSFYPPTMDAPEGNLSSSLADLPPGFTPDSTSQGSPGSSPNSETFAHEHTDKTSSTPETEEGQYVIYDESQRGVSSDTALDLQGMEYFQGKKPTWKCSSEPK